MNRRIIIFGLPGSGKSTFANKLSKKLGIPVHHLDKYFFTKNWAERPTHEFMNMQNDLVAQEKWIIDGNAMSSLETRFAKADIAIYFCSPRLVCLWRLLKRRFWAKRTSQDLPQESKDKITWKLIDYMWHFDARYAAKIAELRNKYPQVNFYKITSDLQLEELLEIIFPTRI